MDSIVLRNPPRSPFGKGGLEGLFRIIHLIRDNMTYLLIEPLSTQLRKFSTGCSRTWTSGTLVLLVLLTRREFMAQCTKGIEIKR